jgi:hypothetical protein
MGSESAVKTTPQARKPDARALARLLEVVSVAKRRDTV